MSLKLVPPTRSLLSSDAEISVCLKALYRRRAMLDQLIRTAELYSQTESIPVNVRELLAARQAVAH